MNEQSHSRPDYPDNYITNISTTMIGQIDEYLKSQSTPDAINEQADIAARQFEQLLIEGQDQSSDNFDFDIELYEDREILKAAIGEYFPDFDDRYGETLVRVVFERTGMMLESEEIMTEELNTIIAGLDERVYYDLSDTEIQARKIEIADRLYYRYGQDAKPLVKMCDIMNGRGVEITNFSEHDVRNLNLEYNAIHPGRQEIYQATKAHIVETIQENLRANLENTFGKHDDDREARLAQILLDVGTDLASAEWELNHAKDIRPERLEHMFETAIDKSIKRLDEATDGVVLGRNEMLAINTHVHTIFDQATSIIKSQFEI